MNRYVKEFFHRGLIFGGFGPIVLGIIYAVIESTVADFSLSGMQILVAIVSIYLLAFVQAGATVFNQIEHWSLFKSLACHFTSLYLVYVGCYLLNDWIPFNANVLLIFTAVFLAIYIAVWVIVLVSIKIVSKKLNRRII